ncbi:MAG: transposase [Candidatus Riflebacteria bacterium]|nr:transposase [Candidatus Riflebacteria bacterium]
MLPLVLYDGKRRWDAALEVGELLPELPEELARFAPRGRCFLLDEGTFSESELASVRNLAAALFRLENSRTPADAAVVVRCLCEWLSSPEQARLRNAFRVWLTEDLVPGKLRGQSVEGVRELDEVRSTLEARVKEWTRQWRSDGRKSGLKKGRKAGRKEGKAELLLGQLETRFGAVTEECRKRVQTAAEP